MKTLSFQQPWASLIAAGIKDVENRSWNTEFRGKFLIHASSKRVTKSFEFELPIEWTTEILNHEAYGNIPDIRELPTSAIIGYVELEDVVENADSVWAAPGQLHWKLKNAYMFDEPITGVNGKLHFFDYPGIDENNLPAAHKVELRKLSIDGDKVIMPVYDQFIDDYESNPDYVNVGLDFTPDIDEIFTDKKNGNRMRQFSKLELVGETKRVTYDIEEVSVHYETELDDEGNPIFNEDGSFNRIRLWSMNSTADDGCVYYETLMFCLKR